jgi:hypothetical protein
MRLCINCNKKYSRWRRLEVWLYQKLNWPIFEEFCSSSCVAGFIINNIPKYTVIAHEYES